MHFLVWKISKAFMRPPRVPPVQYYGSITTVYWLSSRIGKQSGRCQTEPNHRQLTIHCTNCGKQDYTDGGSVYKEICRVSNIFSRRKHYSTFSQEKVEINISYCYHGVCITYAGTNGDIFKCAGEELPACQPSVAPCNAAYIIFSKSLLFFYFFK